MSNQKSKPTGTIHVRTTPASMKTTSAPNATDSAIPALEASSTPSDQVTAATDATAIAADNAPGTAPVENLESASVDAVRENSPAETAPDTSASNATLPPAPATMPLESEPAPATVPLEPAPEAAGPKTKMEIATEIFKRMKKGKGATRKEIIDQFVAEAKLSKAGASTYYQLVKSKFEKK